MCFFIFELLTDVEKELIRRTAIIFRRASFSFSSFVGFWWFLNSKNTYLCIIYKFAGPLPRACQIISNVLLTSNFCICPPAFFRKNAIETNLNSIFEHRTWARAAMFEICARTVVSCLRSAHARRLLWEPLDMFIVCCFDVRGPFFRSHFRYILFLKNGAKWTPTWLQKLRKSYQKWHLKWSRKNMHKMC